MELSSLKLENLSFSASAFRIFPKEFHIFFLKITCPEKVSHIFSKTGFQIFRKQNIFSFKKFFLYFRKGIFGTLAYLELEAYPEPLVYWEPQIFRTLSNIYDGTFCKNSYLVHFLSPSSKNKKNSYVFLYFWNWNFLGVILINFLYFLKGKLLCFGKWKIPQENSFYFRNLDFFKFQEATSEA